METIVQLCVKLRDNCKSADFPNNSPADGCFAMIYNHATIVLELLNYYIQIWDHLGREIKRVPGLWPADRIREAKRDNTARVVSVLSDLFVHSLSSIEFGIKSAIAQDSSPPLQSTISRQETLLEAFEEYYAELPSECQRLSAGIRKLIKDVPPYDSFRRTDHASSNSSGQMNRKFGHSVCMYAIASSTTMHLRIRIPVS